MSSIKADPRYQWAYDHRALYLNMDKGLLNLTGWSFFDDLQGDLDAPECLPIGCTHGRDHRGYSRYYLGFVGRTHDTVEHARLMALSKRLIDQVIAELKAEGAIT